MGSNRIGKESHGATLLAFQDVEHLGNSVAVESEREMIATTMREADPVTMKLVERAYDQNQREPPPEHRG